MKTRDLALQYASRGWAVFPVQPRGKKPLAGTRGFKDATSESDQIAALWRAHPDSNIGVSCGSASDLLVVDIDSGPGKDGLASLERLAKDLQLPETRMARTGGGGIHVFFTRPRGLGCSNAALKQKYPHIDIRGDGGYVVAPGSIHASGATYEWINEAAAIVPVPDNLHALLTQKRSAETGHVQPSTTRILEGSRNAALTSFAGRLRKYGCDAETIEAALQVKNKNECAPPLPQDEVRTIARSVARYEPQADVRFTELWASERAVEFFGKDIRFQADARQWLVWDGIRWRPDTGGHVLHLVSQLGSKLRDEAAQIIDQDYAQRLRKFASTLESRARIRSVVDLAAVNPNLQLGAADLDRDPYLLNLRNGTLHLPSRGLRPHDRSDYITKLVDIEYDETATCPRFDQFVKDIFRDEPETTEYLRRYFGYCLSSATQDQSLLLLIGSGCNGKSVLQSVVAKTLGDYACNASPDTFAVRDAGGARGDLTRLRGARVVFTSESNEDARLDEAMIKRLTGGEPIVARALYQGEQEFVPGFKVIFGTNNLPRLTADDAAVWRRLRVVPFKRVIKDSEKDPELASKLILEKQGIMNWLLAGFAEWQANGLMPPLAVRDAVSDHRANLDSIGAFIEANCDVGLDYAVRAGDVFRAYNAWSAGEGLSSITQTRLGVALGRKGFVKRKTHGNITWHGLALKVRQPQLAMVAR